MEFLYNVFVFVHFASWALVFGGTIASMRSKALYKAVTHGAWGAVVAGVIMVGIGEMASVGAFEGDGPSMAKIGVKLVVALAVAIVAQIAVRRGENVSQGLKGAVLGLTLLNILVAVFWN
ncbi:hypothetical protein [Myceligenerans pegani]|uniref:Integral membrane protein n=1 Tax=Myceligenerans pegani TaxID=2776917 RepID=A0ABR9MSK5_9MICO|nr:hypothetical protein [Myceligenerans sp. TRM 65318]MBE1874370.1 hypothetical protein [Myceligenerans sp. TRM 65318]MBE3016641.1 hypothetical protein [Myceligenerans sp. TRM 65318]